VTSVRYAFHGVTLASELSLPELPRTRAASRSRRTVTIAMGGPPGAAPHAWFNEWRVPGRGRRPWLSFARLPSGYLLRFHDLVDFVVAAAGDRVECRASDGLDSATLRHLLLDQVLPLVLARAGDLVLHASAVHVPRLGAAAFVGNAGSGKSTIAGALARAGCLVTGDDSLVVRDLRGTPTVVPSYPGLRLWRDSSKALGVARRQAGAVAHYTDKRRIGPASLAFRADPTPLRVLVVLDRRGPGALRARDLTSRDGLMALAPFVYVMDVEDRAELSRMFGALSALATRVPVVRLRLRDGWTHLPRAAREVLELVRARTLEAPRRGGIS
jgi:hypothetical protein